VRLEALRRTVAAHIDGYIPEALLRESPEDARRARLAVGVAMLLVPVFMLLVVVHLSHQNEREAALNAFIGAVLVFIPILLRTTGRFFLILNGALSLTFACIVLAAVVARGAGITSATVALAEIPLFATLLGGIRVGTAWAIASMVASGAIGWLGHAHLIADRVARENALYDDHASLLVITGTLYLVGVMYEMRKDESLRHIAELENQRRFAEREKMRAAADAEMARSERLASMGRLAAAAAHEINNPLSYVSNNLEFLKASFPADAMRSETGEAIQDALEGVGRIRRIVQDLGTLSRSDTEHIGLVNVASVVQTALKMAEVHTRPKARVRTNFEPVAAVLANESRLVQVFLNLVVNAAQAIPEGRADDNDISVTIAPLGTNQIVIEVRDTGSGIPEELLNRIKEPFFTTKPIGEGTGLGLSLCDGIVRSYGGSIEIQSDQTGTTVRVVLEASSQAIQESERPSGVHSSAQEGPALKVLVIDDDPLVARAFARILRGHHVSLAGSGRDGLTRLERGDDFDVIFCDMMMPDLTGMDVFETLSRERPELVGRIVFMTGGAFTDRARTFREYAANRFIDKPIDASVVRTLLAERAAVHNPSEGPPRRSAPNSSG
jgi:signal transduction histidine kinase/ActR/RegA family two-component response regulator